MDNIIIPRIEAVISGGDKPISDLQLQIIVDEEFNYLMKNPEPIERYNSKLEKIVEDEIERVYNTVPKGVKISYFKGVLEYKSYICKILPN